MADVHDGRDVLYPARLPEFQRILPPEQLRSYVSWFWISRWDIAAGRISRQQLLPFPQVNIVVQAEGVTISGPSNGASHRDLHGNARAVAALLRPASASFMASLVRSTPQRLLDCEVCVYAASLHGIIWKEHARVSGRSLNAG